MYKNKSVRNQGVTLTRLETVIIFTGYIIGTGYLTYAFITALTAQYLINNGL